MAFALTDVRSDLDNLLGTAVDSSTWTTTIKDEACRQALNEYNPYVLYEASFSVSVTGYEQDISSITALNEVVEVSYPWVAGENFPSSPVHWRYSGDQKLYFEITQPTSGQVVRVRYTKVNTVNNLDSAVATTVPDRHRRLLGLGAAKWALLIRIRQLSENPAIPVEAVPVLQKLAAIYTEAFAHGLTRVQTITPRARILRE